jgi:large conductance mechanosensitive channel
VLKEFRAFALRGNVVDMAVGIIIGGAFGKIVTSLVNDVIMPPIGFVIGNVDFSEIKLRIPTPGEKTVDVGVGTFANTVVQFAIVAFAVFLLVKQMDRFRKPAPAAAPTTKDCPFCASAISLKAKRCPNCTSNL